MTAVQIDGGAPVTTLNGAINNSVTTVEITSATGHPTVGDPYYIRVYAAADGFSDYVAGETMKVTARTTTTLTVTRGVDGTSAASHADGDKVILVAAAEILQEHNDHANATTGTPHGTAYETGTTHDARSHAGINAGTATAWETARTITATADIAGTSGSVDGTGNVNWAMTLDKELTSFTPTWTGSGSNPAIGDGILTGWWADIGDIMKVWIRSVMGSTTTYGSGVWQWTVPDSRSSISTGIAVGTAWASDNGTAANTAIGAAVIGGTVTVLEVKLAGSNSSLGATTPFTFAQDDALHIYAEIPLAA